MNKMDTINQEDEELKKNLVRFVNKQIADDDSVVELANVGNVDARNKLAEKIGDVLNHWDEYLKARK